MPTSLSAAVRDYSLSLQKLGPANTTGFLASLDDRAQHARNTAVASSEAVGAAIVGQLGRSDVGLVAAAVQADLTLAAQLLKEQQPEGEALIAPSDLLRAAIRLLERALGVDPRKDPDQLAATFQDAITPAYDQVVKRTSQSLVNDLEELSITTLGELLNAAEGALPQAIRHGVDRVVAWVGRLIGTAISKLVKLLGKAAAADVVKRITDWIGNRLDLEILASQALDNVFAVDSNVAKLKALIEKDPPTADNGAIGVQGLTHLVGGFTHTLDDLDAAVTKSEAFAILAVGMPPLTVYAEIARKAIPALGACVALLVAVDYLDAFNDRDQGKLLDIAGVPTIVDTVCGTLG